MTSEPDDILSEDLELSIKSVETALDEDGNYRIRMHTSRGDVDAILTVSEGNPAAVVFVSGAIGGFSGPAGRLYPRLAESLKEKGVSSLRLNYRRPGWFEECVLDLLGGLSFLKSVGAKRVALVGHSFGGGVVIKAGELSPLVVAVVGLSSQRYGTSTVENLSPKKLLLVHGGSDSVLLPLASKDIYERAREPKRLVLMPGAEHALMEVKDELAELVENFLLEALEPS